MDSERYYLSEQDRRDRHDQVDAEMGGTGRGCGGSFTDTSAPCGGCIDCMHAMVAYGFWIERSWANLVHAAGLEVAGNLTFMLPGPRPEYHDDYGHFCAGERTP
jgi:hypothetical protein